MHGYAEETEDLKIIVHQYHLVWHVYVYTVRYTEWTSCFDKWHVIEGKVIWCADLLFDKETNEISKQHRV